MNKPSEPNIPEKFLKPYNPQETEENIYKKWEKSGFFNPDTCIKEGITAKDAPAFSIVLPPPNVTGTLHMGHALAITIEDIMVRFARMKGLRTLWVPGTDHAGIATQAKVESIIYKEEGKRRQDLGREELVKRIEKFAQESHDTIINQTKRMGASLDWSREAYTLDKQGETAVYTTFKKMYDDGLIYRGYRIVNWDPKGQTTISDDEIVYKEGAGCFYTFKYSKDFPISIATTRPETKVGDTAVAVHPEDSRYKKYIGKEYDIDFAGAKIHIKIISDEAVSPEFGTGAVGVTPAHSHVDWEIAQRHKLPLVQVITEHARMNEVSTLLKDKKISDARAMVVEWLKTNNLLEKEETIPQNLATAERTGGIIEPLPKLQWFIDVNKKIPSRDGLTAQAGKSLKELMLDVVKKKKITFIPDRFENVYTHWISNLHDWCISRQIWFGHRIPVWYLKQGKSEVLNPKFEKKEEIYVGLEKPENGEWEQDPDTLDTWFSSALWTFSTLGWPTFAESASAGKMGSENDFANYHPTSVMETGYDILFFWVARMILMSTYMLEAIPFKTVYLHGLVRNSDGTKMSKSTGAVDPLLMCEKYGTDAVRMSLIIGTGPGSDMKMSEDKIRAYKNFANKLWNITRYVLTSTEGFSFDPKNKPTLMETDEKHIVKLNETIKEISGDMENYRYYLAGEKLYHYVWHTFADVIIEESKEKIEKGDNKTKLSAQWTLLKILETLLRALHPFAPFVTEEIWSDMPIKNRKMLLVENWPKNI